MEFLKFTFLLLGGSCFPSCCFSGCLSLSVTWGLASDILSGHSYLRRHTHTHNPVWKLCACVGCLDRGLQSRVIGQCVSLGNSL